MGKEKKDNNTRAIDSSSQEPEVLEGELIGSSEDPIGASHVGSSEPTEVEPGLEVLPADFADTEEGLPELAEDQEAESSADRGLVRYDALSAYLREIARYPALSREEERELAVRYFEKKDLEAAYKLVSSNLWLVVKLARDYERAARNLLDLIQEGNVGLLEAVKNFDPYRNVRFPSYAVWWVKAYIIRYVIANWRLVKLGTTQAQRKLFFNLKKEKERLEREGFYPGPKLLAEKLNVKESEVVEMEQRLSGADVSVDAPFQDDGEGTLLSVLPSSELSAEELLAQKELRGLVLKAIDDFGSTLNEKEAIIFRERMLGEEKATLQDIAEKLSLSRERVRQLENRIREKLKVYLVERFGTALQDTELEI